MTTVRVELPKSGVCDCAHDEVFHPGGGPCDYHPDPLVSECPCAGFDESPTYRWIGPNVELAERQVALCLDAERAISDRRST